MARIYTAPPIDHTASIKNIKNKKIIDYPLIEHDIIHLHQKFLTNGFQYINVHSVHAGRLIIQSLLSSLQIYQNVAAVTLDDNSLDATVFNVRQMIFNASYLCADDDEQLNERFFEYFNIDFMWIEATSSLLQCAWYNDFERKIKALRWDYHMPIICVRYGS